MIEFARKGNNPLYAVGCLFKGFAFLVKPGLKRFLIVPILVNLLLYSAVFVIAYFYIGDLVSYLLPDWLESISWLSWLSGLLAVLFFACFFVVAFFSFTLLANLIASPFYGKLAEKTESLLIELENETTDNEEPQNSLSESAVEISLKESLIGEWLRLRYLLSRMLLLVIISIIPVVNLIAPLLWVLFGAWGMALEYFTYPLENKGLLFPEQKKLAASVRLGSLSFGGVTMLGLMIPFFNLLIPPAAVIGATIYVRGIQKGESEEQTTEKNNRSIKNKLKKQ